MATTEQETATRAGTPARFQTRHGLAAETREVMVRILNQRLADATVLHAHCKHAHWNVKGPDFFQLHQLFDEVAEAVFPHVDSIAERITALGGVAHGTVRMAAQATTILEFPTAPHDGMSYVEALARSFAQHAEATRQAIHEAEDRRDMATADLFTQMCRDLDKALYFLESHLQGRR